MLKQGSAGASTCGIMAVPKPQAKATRRHLSWTFDGQCHETASLTITAITSNSSVEGCAHAKNRVLPDHTLPAASDAFSVDFADKYKNEICHD
jgi:hypothetical protein